MIAPVEDSRSVQGVLGRALSGHEISAEEGEALCHARGRELSAVVAAADELRERLAVYPEYLAGDGAFLADRMKERARALVGADGLVRPELERWRHS